MKKKIAIILALMGFSGLANAGAGSFLGGFADGFSGNNNYQRQMQVQQEQNQQLQQELQRQQAQQRQEEQTRLLEQMGLSETLCVRHIQQFLKGTQYVRATKQTQEVEHGSAIHS